MTKNIYKLQWKEEINTRIFLVLWNAIFSTIWSIPNNTKLVNNSLKILLILWRIICHLKMNLLIFFNPTNKWVNQVVRFHKKLAFIWSWIQVQMSIYWNGWDSHFVVENIWCQKMGNNLNWKKHPFRTCYNG